MGQENWKLEDLGRNIQQIVDSAVNSSDYKKLNHTIRQAVEKVVDMGADAVRKAVDSASSSASVSEAKPAQVVMPKPALYAKTGGRTAAGVLKVVGGSLLSAVTGMSLLAKLILELVLVQTTGFTFAAAMGLVGLCGGVALIAGGARDLGIVNRFKLYCRTLGDKTHCTLEALAAAVGKSVKYVRRELKGMISQGLFLEGHLDNEETRLITSHETYQYFEQSRLRLEENRRQAALISAQMATVPAQVQSVLQRGSEFIAQIRRCNDEIPGEEISAKISRMEYIVQKIFDRAKAHPEVVGDLKKLMDYYLPMTVKLLNAYADMDAQSVQGENILSAKREIEQTLDTLNTAYEKLLDELFEDTALDVSSDITVLQTLLAQEGLTEDGLTKMKNNHTTGG